MKLSKQIILSGVAMVSLILALALPAVSLAQEDVLNKVYERRPRLQIRIPGFSDFSKPSVPANDRELISIPWICEYISAIYRYGVGAGGILTAFFILVGGFRWTVAGGDGSKVTAAKKMITDAVSGYLLLLCSYVLLYTINPKTVACHGTELFSVPREDLPEVGEEEVDSAKADSADSETESAIADPKTADPSQYLNIKSVCVRDERSKNNCRDWCTTHTNSNDWPKATKITVAETDVKIISGYSSIIPDADSSIEKVSSAVLNAFDNLDPKINKDETLGPEYKLVVTSGWRPLKEQINLVCNDYRKNDGKNFQNKLIAPPGISYHGTGKAVDVRLTKNGKSVTCAGTNCKQDDTEMYVASKKLLELMDSVGFKRLYNEMWHFETGNSGDATCTPLTCLHPPELGKCLKETPRDKRRSVCKQGVWNPNPGNRGGQR